MSAAAAAAAAAAISSLKPSSANIERQQQQLPYPNSGRFSNNSTLFNNTLPPRNGASAASSALGARMGPAQTQNLRDSHAEASSDIVVKKKRFCCIQ